jgi:hypothetical protein
MRGCNPHNGFYPGTSVGEPWPKDMAPWLQELNHDKTREAQKCYSIVSFGDDIIPAEVFGRLTAEFPTMDRSFHFQNLSHREARDLTIDL